MQSKHSRKNSFRIIGGSLRGRRLHFPEASDIRPSPDRVRETLFNWLQPVVAGARCLDLFAGSGALGLEALSRGAEQVTFVEREPQAAAAIRGHLETLRGQAHGVIQADAFDFLASPVSQTFNIVFLDPPYAADLLSKLTHTLEAGGHLCAGAMVYMECAASDAKPQAPDNWRITHSKTASLVGYHLAVRE